MQVLQQALQQGTDSEEALSCALCDHFRYYLVLRGAVYTSAWQQYCCAMWAVLSTAPYHACCIML